MPTSTPKSPAKRTRKREVRRRVTTTHQTKRQHKKMPRLHEVQSTDAARRTRRRAGARSTSATRIAARKDLSPARASRAVRAELESLNARWKRLLPKIAALART